MKPMFTVRVRRIGENHVCLRGSAPRCQRIRGVISRALEQDNAQLENRDQVTIDSIRNHTARHFPVQQMARATYREILERRAKENSVDFIEGVATAITPLAFLEIVMVKGALSMRTTVSASATPWKPPSSSTRSPGRTRACQHRYGTQARGALTTA
jgi:hypothetical protein